MYQKIKTVKELQADWGPERFAKAEKDLADSKVKEFYQEHQQYSASQLLAMGRANPDALELLESETYPDGYIPPALPGVDFPFGA